LISKTITLLFINMYAILIASCGDAVDVRILFQPAHKDKQY